MIPTRRSKLQIISKVLVRDLPRRAGPRPSADNSPEINDVVRAVRYIDQTLRRNWARVRVNLRGRIWTVVVRPGGRLSGEWSAKAYPRPSLLWSVSGGGVQKSMTRTNAA